MFNRPKLAPVTNRTREQGQISIFFSASLVVMISIIAFVINIGLFVKAKINLQNATDAAAFSGAAVQARQLTKISYLNWEMRNIYKEWLYKYYVIGNLNIDDVENPKTTGVMRFKFQEDKNPLSGVVTPDLFNIPAVCIHIAGSQTNICKRYSVPGLPEFGSSNLPGAEEASRAFMDTLINTKVNDCIDRTRLNMTVATGWTYNVLGNSMDETLTGRGPAILSDRQGAWPKAVEMAIRIRNMEKVMNREAEQAGICATGTTPSGLTRCTKAITEMETQNRLGNERIVKAFYSGYRNLGNGEDREMKDSFTLSEIPPQPYFQQNKNNASNLLTKEPYQKQWVDLKLMMVNYAVFYAAMIPRADSKTSGACDISKVAIPVPGYPMGFYKNPDVLTYYAVKGEAEFMGMFNPFRTGPVKLQAYSAAKPMGGRIGPMLFFQRENSDFIVGRADTTKRRSLPYITSYDFKGVQIRGRTYTEASGTPGAFIPGLPLPTNSTASPGSFWLTAPDRPLGGLIADADGIQFGVPNMVYDYQEPYKITGYSSAVDLIHTIKSNQGDGNGGPIGLFSNFQFNRFRGTALSATISPETLDKEIARVRAPTSYEAANYLIPTPNGYNLNELGADSFGTILGTPEDLGNGYSRYRSTFYAPLYKDSSNNQIDLMYNNPQEVLTAITEFMKAQETGLKKYMMSLNKAAIEIWKQKDNVAGGASGSAPGYERAARGVSDINFAGTPSVDQVPASCDSLAGQFLYFFAGNGVISSVTPGNDAGCPKPLGKLLEEYFAKTGSDPTYDPTYYNMNYTWPTSFAEEDKKKMLSAYAPGPFTGVSQDGTFSNPIPGAQITDIMRRNFYSTKFVTLDSLQAGGGARWDNAFPVHSEGTVQSSSGKETSQNAFKNPINPSAVDLDLNSIKY